MNLLRCLIVLSATALASPAADLTGTILDPDGAAVPNARVELYSVPAGARRTATSDADGRYRFAEIAPGAYLAEVRTEGLSAPATRILVDASGTAQNFRLALDRMSSEVVVTAIGSPQGVHEVARAVDVIDAGEVRTGTGSLGEILKAVPGMRAQALGGPGAYTRIVSRGLRPQDTSVTIDGMRFRDAGTTQGDATPFLENLFVGSIDRVEVLRGAGSAVYGSHAIGGVVNVVTDSGGGPLHGEIQGEGGGLGFMRGLARVSGGGERIGFSAGLQHTNVTRGLDGYDPFRNTTLNGAVQAHLRPSTLVALRFWGADGFSLLNDTPYAAPASALPAQGAIRAIPVSGDVQRLIEAGQTAALGGANLIPNLNDPDSRRGSRFQATAAVLTQQLGSRSNLRASYQRVNTRRLFEDGPAGVRFEPLFRTVSLIEGGVDTVQLRADTSTRWGSSFGGYEFERETYFSPYQDFNPDPARRENYTASARQRSHALFGTHQFRLLNERLQVSFSGRHQRFDLSKPSFEGARPVYDGAFATPPAATTGDVAVAYFAARTGTKFRAHAGNGYRAPSIYERFGATFFEGAFGPLGDPRLKPDTSRGFDAGIDQYLFGDRLRMNATYYYTDLREVIAFDSSGFITPATDPYGRFGGYRDTSGGVARGVELGAEASPLRGAVVRAAYTFANSTQRVSTVRDNDFFRAPFIPRHTASMTWSQRIGRRWDAAFDLLLASNHPLVYSRRAFLFDGARRADLAVYYTLAGAEAWKTRTFVKISNAFDNRYLENGFRTPGVWATGGLTIGF